MALPKLNDTPKYSMTIPSTGQEVRFRPFLVKEEKVMLIALESEDQKQQLASIVECSNEECKVDNEVVINVDSMNVEIPEMSNIVELDDNISIEMTWPSWNSVMDTATSKMTESEQMFNVLNNCLVAVVANDERIDLKNESKKDIANFVDSMNSEQFVKVREYVEAMPSLKHPVEFNCSICEHENKTVLEGIQNFF